MGFEGGSSCTLTGMPTRIPTIETRPARASRGGKSNLMASAFALADLLGQVRKQADRPAVWPPSA